MFKLLLFDMKILMKNTYIIGVSILFLLAIILLSSVSTIDIIHSEKNAFDLISNGLFFQATILTFFIVALPIISNDRVKKEIVGGNYQKILFSIPFSKKELITLKFFNIVIYALFTISLSIIASTITFIVQGIPINSYTLYLLAFCLFLPIATVGSFYLVAMFTSNHTNIFAGIIYLLSILIFGVFKDYFVILMAKYVNIVFLISIGILFINYLFSLLCVKYKRI